MSVEQELQKIVAIEQSFDVNSVTYQGLKVWPLVRLSLVYCFRQLNANPNVILNQRRPCKRPSEPELTFQKIQPEYNKQSQAWRESLAPFSLLDNTGALFFSRRENHSEKIEGKFVDRCLDPILERCDPQLNILKIELDFPQGRRKQPRYEPGVFVNPYPCLVKEHLMRRCLVNVLETYPIQNFTELQFIVHKHTGFWIDEQRLLEQIYLLQSYETFFTDLLSIIRPRVVFLVCYYYIVAMALVKTCRELDIETIEVQHGIQGRYHKMYSAWTRIPSSGYELLPDYFWVWSEQCQRDMMETRPQFGGNQTHHLPLVGGNLWLAKWSKEDFGLSEAEKEFLNQLRQYQKVILVSLQIFDRFPELLDLLVPAMQGAAGSCFWLIRFHPLHQGEREVKRILSALQAHNLTNFEIEFSTKMPLYSLLKCCDYHITQSSTVCHEAYALGVKTGIIDPLKKFGYFYYREQIDKGDFDLITQPENIISAIKSNTGNFSANTYREGYIDIKTELAERVLSQVLEQPKVSF